MRGPERGGSQGPSSAEAPVHGATLNGLHRAMSLPPPGSVRDLATRTQASLTATIPAQKSRRTA